MSKGDSLMSHWCATHPRYSAKRKPNSVCGECWKLYFLKNPEAKQIAHESYVELEKLQGDFR